MGSNLRLLIGHRGVGKSTYLKCFLAENPQTQGFDLDAEIALRTQESVADILQRSESEFRQTERQILDELVREAQGRPTMIALGAGFEGPLPEGADVLWLRRSTDASGRVFLNRPRLNPRLSPYQEYLERYPTREKRYRSWATEELWLPEGDVSPLVQHKAWSVPYDLTLLAENFRQWPAFWSKRRQWGIRRFEIRDDLLSATQIALALKDIPPAQILFTCRRQTQPPKDLGFDWPLELGPPPTGANIVSVHEGSLAQAMQALENTKAPLLKLAVPIATFQELQEGHAWWLRDPSRRAFLPRSMTGRWRWYRSLFGPRMPLHFVREGEGSSLDQPFLYQALLQPPLKKYFGAVLGYPVEHSRSPMEHLQTSPYPFVAIDIQPEEFNDALAVLENLGLKFAAVTAPHKLAAGQLVGDGQALNTLVHDGRRWLGTNTDVLALAQLPEGLPAHRTTWIWGRGGMLESLKSVWPNAEAISARQGTTDTAAPDLLIWATGRSRPFQWPKVKPKFVLDLNYGDDSPGLEFAAVNGLPYQSGLKMFKLQAEAQRQFWKAYL